jgi:hypothetical protein
MLLGCKKWDRDFDFIFGLSVRPGHPDGCGSGSYREQGLVGLLERTTDMETFYIAIVFLMMVVLPVVISQRGDADSDVFPSSGKQEVK